MALLAARAQILAKMPSLDMTKLVGYTSDQAHSCVVKAFMVAGLGASGVRKVVTKMEDKFAIDSKVLRAMIQDDIKQGFIPFLIVPTISAFLFLCFGVFMSLKVVHRNHFIVCG